MPKETIGYDGNTTVVKWRKDDEHPEFPNTPGHVQVAVLNPAIDDPNETGAAGWYADLDAEQIDYLIAVLRKARRQAFPGPFARGGLVMDTTCPPLTREQAEAFVAPVKQR
jgi:hypothetical protein